MLMQLLHMLLVLERELTSSVLYFDNSNISLMVKIVLKLKPKRILVRLISFRN